MAITNIDNSTLFLSDAVFEETTLNFAGEDTFVAGTILARKHTSADSYVGTITGTGTRVTTLSAPQGKLKVGAYTLVAGTLSSGVGSWTLTDPDGVSAQFTTASASANLHFAGLGVFVDIADTGTNYATADSVAFTVAAGSGFQVFNPAGGNGAQYPKAILTYEASKATAGAIPARVLTTGQVRDDKLVIDGGASVTAAIRDSLRSSGITPVVVTSFTGLDNQG